MNASGTFRFHKFSEEEKKPNRYETNTNNFYNSNTSRTFQKSKNYHSKFPKTLNNNINNLSSQSYRFRTKYSAEIPNKYLKTFQITNNINNNNLLYSETREDFPYKKIINTDFEPIISHGDLTKINKLLPQMLYNDLSFSNNNHLHLVLTKFQNILRFLFNEQQKLEKNNNIIEELFNNENSNLNKKLKQLEQDESRSNKLLNLNQKEIGKLANKVRIYKNLIISSGNEKLIPNKKLLNIQKKNGYFICQICPAKSFKSYEDIHAHYIMHHFNTFENNNTLYINNPNKEYFDNQLNIFKNEIKNTILNLKKEYEEDNNDNKKKNELKNKTYNINKNLTNHFERNKYQHKTMSSMNLSTYKDLNLNQNNDIDLYLNKLEIEQKNQYERLNNDLRQLKKDILNEIKNIAKNQPISNNNIKMKNSIKDEKNINNDNQNLVNESNENKNISSQFNFKVQTYDLNNDSIRINSDNNNKNKDNDEQIFRNNNNRKNESDNNYFNQNKNIKENYNNNFNNYNENDNNEYLKNKNSVNEYNDNNLEEDKKEIEDYNFNSNNNVLNSNINKEEKNANNININNNFKSTKYINNSKVIIEESGRNDSTLNNMKNNGKFTPGNQSLAEDFDNISKQIKDNHNIDNPFLKDEGSKNISINEIEKPNKFFEKFEKREKYLFNKNDNINEVFKHYDIFKFNKNEENVLNKIESETNKYLNYKDEKEINTNEYKKIILNIINGNNNKGKNNPRFLKYFENIMKKNDLNSICQKMEEEMKQKEIENQNESKKKEELEEIKKKKEEEEITKDNKINFGNDDLLDYYGDILNDNKKSKKIEQSYKGKYNDFSISKDDALEKLKKGNGEEYL